MNKHIIILFLASLVSLVSVAQESKATIIYIFDPICSWCYTFNPVIEKLHGKYNQKVNFSVVSGGMITGKRVRPISEMSEFILAGYMDMQNMTGVEFGTHYIEMVKAGKEILDSERPSFALVAFREIYPDKAIDFTHDLQKLHFLSGYSLNHDSTYLFLANQYGIEGASFLKKMDSDSIKNVTRSDFKKIENAGINSFPTVLISVKGKVLPVTEGFETYEKLEKKIDKLLK